MTAEDFRYRSLPMRVVFGAGSLASLADEVRHLGLSRVLVLSTPSQSGLAEKVSGLLGDLSAGVYTEAKMHVPIASARAARSAAEAAGADGCIAIGGGSTTGLGKAIALESGLPIIAVPTTYAGSEMTPIWGITADGEKKTGRDPKVLPASVIYDPELTLALPVGITVSSAFNAIAHAAEGLYAPDRSPVVSLMAEEGVRSIVGALPVIAGDPTNRGARADALYGAWLCGAVLGATTMSLHHKLCHVLGGTFDLPHAETHTVVLPHVLHFNADYAPVAMAALARATGMPRPASGLQKLSIALGAPRSLRELGLGDDAVERIVELVTSQPYANARPVTPEGVRAVVRAALDGVDI
ncbi:maleylacetate reductase [uncultured Microbacterium sp.]|uniref:maleylacetate reductase n=1 Tax=uncultured Microbacterium sp. TaxID=191216 RepID=UPI0035CB0316